MFGKMLRTSGSRVSMGAVRNAVIFSVSGCGLATGAAQVRADLLVHTTAELSVGRGVMGAGSGNHVAVFAGGYDPFFPPPAAGYSGVVDIYNATTGTWSTGSISPRDIPAVVGIGDNVYIAGGGYSPAEYPNIMDIYNTTTGTWSTTTVPHVGDYQGAAVGGKLFLAGGFTDLSGTPSGVFDVYDPASAQWSSVAIPNPRNAALAAAGNKLFLAGGGIQNGNGITPSAEVDIYDVTANTWDSHTLPVARNAIRTAVVEGKVLFAGGADGTEISEEMDIYDTATDQWSSTTLPSASMRLMTELGPYALFEEPGKIDIYDVETGAWDSQDLADGRLPSAATTVDNEAIFAGESFANTPNATVDIFTLAAPEPGSALLVGIPVVCAMMRRRRASAS